MNFTELLTEVFDLTKRPDLTVRTSQAVRAATLKMHLIDYFPKDLVESGVQFASAEFFQSFDYKNVFPLWRSIKYFRKYDIVGGSAGKKLDVITPAGIFDSYGIEKSDVMYQAGSVFNIKMSTQEQYFLCGFYQYPDCTADGYTSWIAVDQPWAIIYEAAKSIMKTTGRDEDAAAMETDMRQQIAELTINNILAEGE